MKNAYFEVLGAATGVPVVGALQKPMPPVGKLLAYSVLPGVLAGALGAVFWKKHRVLGFLGASAAASSVYPMTLPGERLGAVSRVAAAGTAVAGSLMWKKHPILGYFAGGAVGGVATLPLRLL